MLHLGLELFAATKVDSLHPSFKALNRIIILLSFFSLGVPGGTLSEFVETSAEELALEMPESPEVFPISFTAIA